jgi:hypothetical protein
LATLPSLASPSISPQAIDEMKRSFGWWAAAVALPLLAVAGPARRFGLSVAHRVGVLTLIGQAS